MSLLQNNTGLTDAILATKSAMDSFILWVILLWAIFNILYIIFFLTKSRKKIESKMYIQKKYFNISILINISLIYIFGLTLYFVFCAWGIDNLNQILWDLNIYGTMDRFPLLMLIIGSCSYILYALIAKETKISNWNWIIFAVLFFIIPLISLAGAQLIVQNFPNPEIQNYMVEILPIYNRLFWQFNSVFIIEYFLLFWGSIYLGGIISNILSWIIQMLIRVKSMRNS